MKGVWVADGFEQTYTIGDLCCVVGVEAEDVDAFGEVYWSIDRVLEDSPTCLAVEGLASGTADTVEQAKRDVALALLKLHR